MADIFDSYPMSAAWDEMFARPGQPRPVEGVYHGPPSSQLGGKVEITRVT